MECTGNRVQVVYRRIPESSGVGRISLGSLRGGKQLIAQWHFWTLLHDHNDRWAYWRCRSSSREGNTSAKFHPRVLVWVRRPDRTECFPNRKWLSVVVPRVTQLFSRCMGTIPEVRPVTFYGFHLGGSKPEVVVESGFWCTRGFLDVW